ncbi:hypothetical protein HAX54_016723 [Datura stramonium]|uniref:R13L1/DRL21-like LRR repeat region domain-containing protein n=1 Tax=Datura stramonium TaxID=4076 RepID=A0ABS8ULB0_DATST|nr:hypothetical protein [Datura stramonium]
MQHQLENLLDEFAAESVMSASIAVEKANSNLQTLNLSSCGNLMELPFGLANITGLRHLNIAGCDGLTRLPAGLGNLVQLQTLLYLLWGKVLEKHHRNQFSKLKGELSIRYLENIKTKKKLMAESEAKKYVELLRLQWGSGNKRAHSEGWQQVYLRRGDVILYLPLGTSFLKRLHLQGMDGVTHIGEEFYGGKTLKFPSLEDLTIKDLPCLKEWSCIENGAVFPRLQKLVVDKCPNLITAPTFQSLLYLRLVIAIQRSWSLWKTCLHSPIL